MSDLTVPGLVVFCLVVGLIKTIRDRISISEEVEFTANFLEKLKAYATSNGQDMQAYSELVFNQYKMQAILGPFGILSFREPYSGIIHQRYHLIPNHLLSLRDAFLNDNGYQIQSYHDQLVQTLLGYMGYLNQVDEGIYKNLRNPLIWFREGVKSLLFMPFFVLHSLGLIPDAVSQSRLGNRILTLISSLVALIGLLSAIMQVTLTWEPFVAWVKTTLNIP